MWQNVIVKNDLLKVGLTLVAIWALAAGIIAWARSAKPTAKSVAAYIQENNLAALSGDRRTKTIHKVEDMLNRIPLDERQELQRRKITRTFFEAMTPAEREAFLDATLPDGFRQLMESFNRMNPADRKRIVDNALTEMKKHEGEQPPERSAEDARLAQHVVDQGLRSFYKDADSDVKLDLAPLIEQMQRNMQTGR